MTVPQLQERFDGLAYGYRMACACGQPTFVTAETYFREETKEARVPCDYCSGTVHFGPAVALLRHPDDPALNNHAISHLAWYHTSTWPDWPSPAHRSRTEATLKELAGRLPVDFVDAIEGEPTMALHVGTYEAAIENMLRRMHDQDDARSQFYLYRVAIQIAPERINEGFRDENAEEAAQLTIGQLDSADLDAIRYLNVHEAIGSLSLAVRPRCVASVQRLAIPAHALSIELSESLSSHLNRLEHRRSEIAQVAVGVSGIEGRLLRRMQLGLAPDPDGLGQRAHALEVQMHGLWHEVETALAQHHMSDISPVVGDQFRRALAAWRSGGDVESVLTFSDFFGASSALLARSPQVIDLVSVQPRTH